MSEYQKGVIEGRIRARNEWLEHAAQIADAMVGTIVVEPYPHKVGEAIRALKIKDPQVVMAEVKKILG